jgi:hypothetical protein
MASCKDGFQGTLADLRGLDTCGTQKFRATVKYGNAYLFARVATLLVLA